MHPENCDHLSAATCALRQRAEARKYDVNLTWLFAEIEPDVFVLYSPIRREVILIGTIEEILAAYRARKPFIRVTQSELTRLRPSSRFQNVKVNI